MSETSPLLRELRFFLRQRFSVWLIVAAASLSAFAVWSGLAEVTQQRQVIEALLAADAEDRAAAIAKESDYGGAAYYSFHLTYDPPSALAFAALGERDVLPWKHRIRMLAIEGQIYETDAANAELSQAGVFDFAFVVSVLVPLLLIVLLHDMRASERASGRHDLLVASAGAGSTLWRTRALVRVGLLALAILIPFLLGALVSGVSWQQGLFAVLTVLAHVTLWSALCVWASAKPYSGPAIASGLLAVWMVTTFVLPAIGEAVIEAAVPAPEGGDIILAQREAVNDAWDLPKEATMQPFVAAHPEWADYATISAPFEWKWYYAFQQMGDQAVAEMSADRRQAALVRGQAAWWAAILSPASMTQRVLSRLADTDMAAALRYQQRVRAFHASLRAFYYPLLFKAPPYDKATFAGLPQFDADAETSR